MSSLPVRPSIEMRDKARRHATQHFDIAYTAATMAEYYRDLIEKQELE